jgi:hypothetical protein
MRADIHGGPEQKLQSEAGYIDARPQTDSSTKTSCNARPDHTFGSFSTELGCPRHVRFTPDSDQTADIAGGLVRAMAQSRCAPARCAGARAERLVADGEDSDSGVASINLRIVGVQRMIKNSRIICGQHPFTANYIDWPITQIQKIGLTNSANQFA